MVCRRRFPFFCERWQKEIVARAKKHLKAVRRQLDERNDLAHRIWSIPAGHIWGGYKGTRSFGENATKQRDRGWKYSEFELRQRVATMVGVIEAGDPIMKAVTGLPRLPTLFAFGVPDLGRKNGTA